MSTFSTYSSSTQSTTLCNSYSNSHKLSAYHMYQIKTYLKFIIIPTYAQICSVKLILKFLRHTSLLIHNLQGVFHLCQRNLRIINMTKYNTVACFYDTILVNVASHVIPGLFVLRLSGVNKHKET